MPEPRLTPDQLVREDVVTLAQWERAIALRNADMPDGPTTVERAMRAAAVEPAHVPRRRVLLTLDGRDVGLLHVGQAFWTPRPELFSVVVMLAPGADADLAEAVVAVSEATIRELGGTSASAWFRTDRPLVQAALRARGYTEGQRNPVSVLDLGAFDPAPWAGRIEAVRAAGYTIVDLATYAAAHPETWRRELWRLEMDVLADVPLPEPFVEIPFEEWDREWDANELKLEWIFFAVRDGELAGLTQLFPNFADARIMNTGMTGVRRDHRRQGLAAALKAHALGLARGSSAERVYTDNEEGNPMYQLNLALGFRALYETVNATRDLG